MGGWNPKEKLFVAGLWALPGPGARTLEKIRAAFPDVGVLADLPFEEWLHALVLPSQAGDVLAAARDAGVRTAAESAERLFERCDRTHTQWTFEGEPDYPALVGEIDRAPPILFFQGKGANVAPRLRVAMVGTRKVEASAMRIARLLADALARSGIGVVSGAAEGIDTESHLGALGVAGETWAFLGSSIDQVDAAPRRVCEPILAGGGTVYSDYPPGVRAQNATFPRRNRLIAGASDVTVVVRARFKSGALHTARFAREQGKPVLAAPGDVDLPTAVGSNQLLRDGEARPCLDVRDILKALGLPVSVLVAAPPPVRDLPTSAGPEARRVFEVLAGTPMDFDALMVASGLSSGALSAALTALELCDAVLERPGRVFYRAQ